MFIAMNRFRVANGSEAAFEHVWLSRDSHLDKVRSALRTATRGTTSRSISGTHNLRASRFARRWEWVGLLSRNRLWRDGLAVGLDPTGPRAL
jgi:hypothetical protein